MFSGLKNKLNIIHLRLLNVLSRKMGIDADGRNKEEIIVSLTSYPKRSSVVFLTIESLLNQTLKPSRIILWLSKVELPNFEVPKKLSRMKERGLEIRLVDGNLKSYKKLIYAIENCRHSLIITVDDDTIYPLTFVEDIYSKRKEHRDCVVAFRCSMMGKFSDNRLTPYLQWPPAEANGPSYNLFPTGVGGILYPPGSLHEQTLNKKLFLKLAPSADDIWFKAMALLANTKTVMVNRRSIEFPTIAGSQKEALWRQNNLEHKNDEQLKSVFDHFNLYPKIH